MQLIAKDRWLALDKLEHVVWAFLVWTGLKALAPGMAPLGLIGLFAVAAVGVELVELYRFWRWTRKGQPQPYPWLCDQLSWRDLIADVAGALLAAGAIARICR